MKMFNRRMAALELARKAKNKGEIWLTKIDGVCYSSSNSGIDYRLGIDGNVNELTVVDEDGIAQLKESGYTISIVEVVRVDDWRIHDNVAATVHPTMHNTIRGLIT